MGRQAQAGQALIEALLVLGGLGSFWIAISWLGQLQDIRQQLDHASRHAAFAHAYQGLEPLMIDLQVQQDLSGPGNRWQGRDGQARAAGAPRVSLDQVETPPFAQIGDPLPIAAALRAELQLGDALPWRAHVSLTTRGLPTATGTLRDFDQLGLSLHRHTAIAAGSGAAHSDAAVQDTLGRSAAAWRSMAEPSRGAGQAVSQRMAGVDQAWGRAQPDWDWLSSWVGRIPARYLEDTP